MQAPDTARVPEPVLKAGVEPGPVLDAVVIGAGQAGLATSYFLRGRGIDHLVLDANPQPGGAWQHRWASLTMRDVHGVSDLPGSSAPDGSDRAANLVVPDYFDGYERWHHLPVVRPVRVDRVDSEGGLLVVHAGERVWRTRTLVNATGTWTRPFVPYYPGAASFRGEQVHTARYPAAEHFRGRRVLVVGGGASAVQHLGELAPVTDTLWVTRRPPVWREDDFDSAAGLAAVTAVEDRVRRGLPPASVVSVTGLLVRPQEQEAARLGAYDRLPMFERIEPDGVRWADGRFERVDAIIWATGFRPAVDHLAPLGLRSSSGGIALVPVPGNVQAATTAARDPRVQLVGYGPSASTLGVSRAGRQAALAVSRHLGSVAA
ncbi:NAD(P)-binding domain-containing protein [Nocardioides sp. zg-1228]|uniref:NAD(P)-binding domain-containing protein n=1 Tax=Nocardioides sp. zg-1228 TaxID=2763008 RepID=UPI00164323C3|nr:NAD(P)-binding domain-containing protein [Nocardioides sp. zg-1228]MBC2932903.1 NAD(P)/FAD-dependent oxidoreductase [Nocardioides sp. zg-1228]QSF56892.1 NAD(P)/FAD-dependent oxidoreductase [Nocardioides sp. zg-1228]